MTDQFKLAFEMANALADEIERIRPRLAALEAFATSAKHLIGQTCYEYDDAPDAWNATADAWAALEATGPVLDKKP